MAHRFVLFTTLVERDGSEQSVPILIDANRVFAVTDTEHGTRIHMDIKTHIQGTVHFDVNETHEAACKALQRATQERCQ